MSGHEIDPAKSAVQVRHEFADVHQVGDTALRQLPAREYGKRLPRNRSAVRYSSAQAPGYIWNSGSLTTRPSMAALTSIWQESLEFSSRSGLRSSMDSSMS